MAPDPPRVGDEYLSSVSSDLLTMATINSDDSDNNDDSTINDQMVGQGYMLFVGDGNDSFYQNDTSVFDDDDCEPDDTDSDVGNSNGDLQHTNFEACTQFGVPIQQIRPQSNNEEVDNSSELSSTINGCETDYDGCSVRSDIKVDCDQVKAAMIGFTLPPSAIPPWAVGISDQDIATHVNRLLSVNNNKK